MDSRVVVDVLKEILNFVVEEVSEEIHMDREKPRRLWERKWISRRQQRVASSLLLRELAVEDPIEYYHAMRLNQRSFEDLLSLVGPSIQRNDTFMRLSLPAKVKLETVLYMIAHGSSLRCLQHLFRVSKSTISLFIPEVCQAIYRALKDYIMIPNQGRWKANERGFRNSWQFPGCCGAIDGKHVVIKAPFEAGSYYFNYKKQNSIVLLAVVDHDYCFSYYDVGCNGRAGDAGVFESCKLSKALENSLLPEGHILVGDNAFPLKPYLLKPYAGYNLTYKKKIFNYRLSRARRIVENGFGILVSRFRILEKPLPFQPDKVDIIVKACLALHNWMRKTNNSVHRETFDLEDTENGEVIPGSWRSVQSLGLVDIEHGSHRPRRPPQSATHIRDTYADYFVGEGEVSWQSRMVN